MVARVISELEVLSPAVGQKYGLCEQIGGEIVQYIGGGSGKKIGVDLDGTWSYFRLTGKVRKQRADVYEGCSGWKHTIPLRFVLATRRDGEPCDVSARIIKAESDMHAAERPIRVALRAANVLFVASDIEADSTRALKSEMPGASLPLELVYQYADLTIEISSSGQCLTIC